MVTLYIDDFETKDSLTIEDTDLYAFELQVKGDLYKLNQEMKEIICYEPLSFGTIAIKKDTGNSEKDNEISNFIRKIKDTPGVTLCFDLLYGYKNGAKGGASFCFDSRTPLSVVSNGSFFVIKGSVSDPWWLNSEVM